jgi:hypothetical protein
MTFYKKLYKNCHWHGSIQNRHKIRLVITGLGSTGLRNVLEEFEVRELRELVTICGLSMLILSCSIADNEETISFEKEPSFSVSIDRVIEDRLTMVVAVDDSASMVAKITELDSDMEGLFTDLIEAGWSIDLNLVTCAFYKGEESDMKSVSTDDFQGQNTEEIVQGLMEQAAPGVDLTTLQNDADERCNQSLERAWSLIEPTNKINMSLIISNEDGCGRDESQQNLVHLDGSPRDNCAPVTYNQIMSTGISPLATRPFEDWVSEVENYSDNVWVPWFNNSIRSRVHSPQRYADFFQNLESRGQERVENFTHIYLPIVVDSPTCLAETLYDQFLVKEEAARQAAVDAHNASGLGTGSDVVFNGLEFPLGTRDILGNIGYSYLETFDILNQDIEFSRSEGDLSLCRDLSHIVNKISREIKLRGAGIQLQLPRPIDIDTMIASEGPNFKILKIVRPSEVEEPGFFEQQNSLLSSFGLEWVREDNRHWSLEIGFNSAFLTYEQSGPYIELLPNRYVSITGGDEIFILEYFPTGFKEI